MNTRSFAREAWKEIQLGEGFTNNIKLEVSDFGRVRSYNKINNGKLMKGSMINGYRIIRIKLFRPRSEEATQHLLGFQSALAEQSQAIRNLQKAIGKSTKREEQDKLKKELEATTALLNKNKKAYTSQYNRDAKKRTFYYAALIHRLVAENFLPAPSADQTIVTHLDYDKLNNEVSNLKWITEDEKNVLQRSSPLVIAERKKRKQSELYTAGNFKLSVTKVMFLKKLLNEGKSVRSLAKQFRVTETHILNIKKELSWGSVEAAK